MSGSDDITENTLNVTASERLQVDFDANDRVVGYGSLREVAEPLPIGVVRTATFTLPLSLPDPDKSLYDYKKLVGGDWELIGTDECLARDEGDLEVYRASAIRALETRIAVRTEKATLTGVRRDRIHTAKLAEVAAYEDDSLVVGPYITTEMAVKNKTAAQVVAGIKSKQAAEAATMIAHEQTYLTIKEALDSATTHAAVKAALALLED